MQNTFRCVVSKVLFRGVVCCINLGVWFVVYFGGVVSKVLFRVVVGRMNLGCGL